MQRYAICDRSRLQAVGEQWKLLCARVATQLGQSEPLPPPVPPSGYSCNMAVTSSCSSIP